MLQIVANGRGNVARQKWSSRRDSEHASSQRVVAFFALNSITPRSAKDAIACVAICAGAVRYSMSLDANIVGVYVQSGADADTIIGTDGGDTLTGGGGNDGIDGRGGDDRLSGKRGQPSRLSLYADSARSVIAFSDYLAVSDSPAAVGEVARYLRSGGFRIARHCSAIQIVFVDGHAERVARDELELLASAGE